MLHIWLRCRENNILIMQIIKMLKLHNSHDSSKVDADAKPISEILYTKKYDIDVFQREYKWGEKQIQQLLSDLESKFRSEYDEDDDREAVQYYAKYYLGTIITNRKGPKYLIIDGQQRLTSITLLLIYLHNLQQKSRKDAGIKNLIFSAKFGRKSYNLDIADRTDCMDALYHNKTFNPSNKDESVMNIKQRYEDIEAFFPEEIKGKHLPYFIDWLTENVMLVEITTHSDEDAYTIFETMNDRGLSLTPTEMLKGYLLSNLNSDEKKAKLNDLWKKRIAELSEINKDTDIEFFKAWFRAKYAESIRLKKKGSENEDFEKIALRFHSWIRDNKVKVGLNSPDNFYNFISVQFSFFSDLYLQIVRATITLDYNLEHIFYIKNTGFPDSFSFPLIMSTIKVDDDQKTIQKKIALVSRFLETFIVYRFVNYKTLSYSSIRYAMFSLIKEIRDKTVPELVKILKLKINEFEVNLDGMANFRLHQQNKRRIQFLLARITSHVEKKCNIQTNFKDYVSRDISKPFEIEHIWAREFKEHIDEFNQEEEFEDFRNKIGGLILIPQGFNQSFGSNTYEEKLPHYFGQNMLAKTLNSKCYENNPSFISYMTKSKLPFRAHECFKKSDMLERQKLYQKICEEIWDINVFDEIVNR